MKPLNPQMEADKIAGGGRWGVIRPFDGASLARPGASNRTAVQRLQELARAENGAVELYRKAMESVGCGDAGDLLQQIHAHHGGLAQNLGRRLSELGEPVDQDTGAWGMWGRAMLAMASQFGGAAILRALKESEEQTLADSRRGLEELDAESRMLVRRHLIPWAQRHIHLLAVLLEEQPERPV